MNPFDNFINGNLTPIDKSIIENLPFEITVERLDNDSAQKVPEDLNLDCYDRALKGGNKNAEKIKQVIKRYPQVPALYNYLYNCYINSKQKKRAENVQKIISEKFPDYLFGKITIAEKYLKENKFSKIPEVLGEKLELHELLPDRKIFHVTEFNSFYGIAGMYYCAIKNKEKAERCLQLVENSPKPRENFLREFRLKFLSLRMETSFESFAEDEKRSVKVNVNPKKIGENRTEKCTFNHPEIEQLYKYDFEIPEHVIKKIKQLPKETLLEDLLNVLKDSILRFDSYKDDVEDSDFTNYHFLNHALYLLTDVDDGSNLQNVLDVFRQSLGFYDFWFGEIYNDTPYFTKFGYDRLDELRDFIVEPNVCGLFKAIVIKAIFEIADSNNAVKEEILEFIQSLFGYFYENRDDKNVLDTDVLLEIIIGYMDMRDHRGDELIREFFKMDIIPHNYAGNCEELISSIDNEKKKFRATKYVDYESFLQKQYKSQLKNPNFDRDKKAEEKMSNLKPTPNKKVGRNDPCPCGSGKKYKKCCMHK